MLNFKFVFVLLLLTSLAFSQATLSVNKNPFNGVSNTSTGTISWSNPARVNISDNAYATATIANATGETNYIIAYNYSFNIPTGSLIDGIVVNIERKSAGAVNQSDSKVYLMKNNVIGGTNLANITAYTTSDVVSPHGSPTELWGQTWKAEDINNVTFGVAFSVKSNTTISRVVSIDNINITVYYREPFNLTLSSGIIYYGTNTTFSCTSDVYNSLKLTINGVDKSCENNVSKMRYADYYTVNCSWVGNLTHPANSISGVSGTYGYWEEDTTICEGIPNFNSNHYTPFYNFSGGENINLIQGQVDGKSYGYTWNGTGWSSNTSLVTGLPDVGSYSSPSIIYNFNNNNAWTLFVGEDSGMNGFQWNGTSWVGNTSLIIGLTASTAQPIVPLLSFNLSGDDKWYVFDSHDSDDPFGYVWNGINWTRNDTIVTGISGPSYGPNLLSNIFNVYSNTNSILYTITNSLSASINSYKMSPTWWVGDYTKKNISTASIGGNMFTVVKINETWWTFSKDASAGGDLCYKWFGYGVETGCVTDSCTYSGSGDWNIVVSDNCTINSDVNCGANSIKVNGTGGTLTINASVTAHGISLMPSVFNGEFIVRILQRAGVMFGAVK